MASETEFDNEGIKKGLQQINLQLNETNKQLAEQSKPNLFKAFKENQAEVLASLVISKKEMAQDKKFAEAVVDDIGTVKVPRDAKGRAISRRPPEGDTLYGMMAKLVTISYKSMEDYEKAKKDAERRFEEEKASRKKQEERDAPGTRQLLKNDADRKQLTIKGHKFDKETAEDAAELQKKLAMESRRSFKENFLRGFTGLKNPSLAQAKISRDTKKLLGKGLLTRAKVLKRMIKQGKLSEGLGKKIANFFSKDKKDKKDQAGLLSRGFSKLGGILKSGFNALTSTFGFLLKTAAVLLTIGLIFKFLDSDYWKSIKPNIGNIIAQSVIVAENIVNFLISVIKDVLIPALMTLAEVTFFVAKKIGAFFGFQFAEGRADEIKKEIDADPSYKSDAEREKAVKDKLAFEKEIYMRYYDPFHGVFAGPRLLGNYLMGNSIEDMRRNNSISFDTKAGSEGASFQGKKFSFRVPAVNMYSSNSNIDASVNSSSLISGSKSIVPNAIFRQLYLDHK